MTTKNDIETGTVPIFNLITTPACLYIVPLTYSVPLPSSSHIAIALINSPVIIQVA